MALTVEDGTGVALADSYVSAAEVKAYGVDHKNRYPTVAAITDDNLVNLEPAARVGTIFVDGKGRDKRNDSARWWPGTRVSGRQALAWPRTTASYTDGTTITDPVPIQIKRAVLEAACYDFVNPGVINNTIVQSDLVKKEKVGTIEVEYVGRTQDIEAARTILTLIEDYIAQIIRLPEVSDGSTGTTTSANFNFLTIGS